MKIETVKISSIQKNPDNPRRINDDKFIKLVNSIKEFPEMLKIRPIVVNDDMMILGGNMRLLACKEAGLKEVHIIKASQLTDEQQKEFIIKDNVGFGEWDWDILANEWNSEPLQDWGLNVMWDGIEFNNLSEDEFDTEQEFDPIGDATDLHKVIFIFDNEGFAKEYFDENIPNLDFKKFYGGNGNMWQVNLSSNYGK